MRVIQGVILLLLSVGASTSHVHAGYIVNTGAPSAVLSGYTLNISQHLAAEFSVSDSYVVNSVEGFVATFGSIGDLQISLHSDAGAIPGAALYSAIVTPVTQTSTWNGAFGLNWALSSGTYWISFNAINGYFGGMPYDAPSPLSLGYAVRYDSNVWNPVGGSLNLGIRIDATAVDASPTPEPASMALLAMGGGLLAFGRKKLNRRKQTADLTA